MDHHEQHHQHHEKEREEKKKHQKEYEAQQDKATTPIHPAWFVGLGAALIILVVLVWTFAL